MAAVGTLLLLVQRRRQLPMGWDEGNAIYRAKDRAFRASRWKPGHQVMGSPGSTLPGPMSREAINADWQYTTRIEGHPVLYGIVLALGHSLGRSWLCRWRAGGGTDAAVCPGGRSHVLSAGR